VTPLSYTRIAVSPRHIVREAALVNVHNRPVLCPIGRSFISEDAPFFFVRLGAVKRFLAFPGFPWVDGLDSMVGQGGPTMQDTALYQYLEGAVYVSNGNR
jgi:hypothetical protein